MANETAFIPPSIQDEQDYAAIRDDVAKRYPQLDALLKTDEAAIRQAISGDAAPPKVGNPDFQAAIDQHFMTSTSNYLTAIDVLNGRLSPAELNKVLGRSEDRPRAEAMFRDALMQVASTPAFESVRPKDTRNALGQIATQFGRGVGDVARNTESLAVDFLGAPFLSADDSRDRTLAADIRSVKERVDPAGLTPHEGYSFWHGVLSGVRSAPFAIGGTAASLAGGFPAAVGYTFTQTAPDAYREYKSRGLSDNTALTAAIGTGAIEAVIEQWLPFEKQLMPEFKAVITDSLRQRLTKFAVEHGANFLKENLEEVLQDASREAVGKLAAVVSQNPKYDGFDWSKFDASSIAETATAVATMMAPGTVVAGNNIRMGMPDARQMLSDEFLEAWTKLHPDTPLKQGMSRTEFDKAVGVGRGKMNEIQRDAFAARATEMQAGILAKNSETNQVEGDSGENGTEEAPFVLRDSIKVKFDSGLDAALYQVATKPNAKRTASVIAEIAEAIGQPPDVVNRMATRLAEAVEKGRDAAKLSGNERFTFLPFYDPKNIDEDLLKPPGGQTGAVPNNAEAPTAESVQTPNGVPNEEGQADRQGREGQQRLLTPAPSTGAPSADEVKTAPVEGVPLSIASMEADFLDAHKSHPMFDKGVGLSGANEGPYNSGDENAVIDDLPSSFVFPRTKEGKQAYRELHDALPKELQKHVTLARKAKGYANQQKANDAATGQQYLIDYEVSEIANHLVRVHGNKQTNARRIEEYVNAVIREPEKFSPEEVYQVKRYEALKSGDSALTDYVRRTKPVKMTLDQLGVGDTFEIAGDKHTVESIDPDAGTITVRDGIKITLPEQMYLLVDDGSIVRAKSDLSFGDDLPDVGATSGTIETQPPQQPPTPQPEPQYTPGVPTETQSGAVHGTQQQTADSPAQEAPEARTEAPKQENAHSSRPPVPPENIAAFADLLDRKKGPRAFHTRDYARAISMAAEAIHEPEKRASAEEMARIGAERFNANPSGETARLLPIVDSGRAFENAQDVHIAREMVNQLASAALKTGNEKEIQKAVEREVRFRNTATQASDLLRAYRDYEDGPAARAAAIRAAFYSPPLWMTGDDAARKWGDKLKSLANDLLKEHTDIAAMMEPSFYEDSQNLTEPIDESTEQGKALADALRSLKRAFTIASQKLFSSAGLPPLDAELVKAFGNVVYQAAKYGMVRFKQFVRQVSRQIGTDRTIAAGRELQAAWDQHAKQDKRLDASSNVKDILRPKRDSKGNVPKVNLFEGKSIKEWAYVMRRIQTMKADYADKAFEYWINVSVLSGLRTMVANTLGNASNLTWRLFVDRSWQGLLNDIQRAAGMDVAKSAPALADAVTVAKGLMYGMKDAYRLAWLTWDLELNYHGGSQKFDEAPTSIGGTTGRVVRTPGRMNNAVDMFFRTISARAVAGATANRIAINEGLTGQAKSDRIGELLEDMESEAWHSAYNEADVITLREQLDPLSSQILAIKRQYRALNYIFLFVSITSNTLRQGLRMVPPIGTAEFAYRYLRGQLKDNPELTRELINRQLLGLMMLGTIASTNDPDDPWITGAEEAASGARDFQRREGNTPPLSIKIPGIGWVSYRMVEPIATMLATMVDEVSAMKKATGVIDFSNRFSKSLTRQIQSKTFLQYFGDMINGMVEAGRYAGGDTDAQGLFQQMAHWAVNFTESWVDPALVRQAFNAADPYQRDTRVWANGDQFFEQVVDRALQRNWVVKFWTGEYGPMRYDLWGRPMVKTGSPLGDPTSSFFWRLLSPIEYFGDKEPYIGDRILAKHNELYEDLYPKAPQRSYQLNGKSRSMTDEQFDEFAHLSGVVTRNIIDRMELREVPEAAVYIQEAVSWAREQVRKRLVGEWHGGDTGPVDTDMLGRVGAAELLRKHPEAARPDRLDTPGTFQIRRDETMRRNMELIQRRQNALNPR